MRVRKKNHSDLVSRICNELCKAVLSGPECSIRTNKNFKERPAVILTSEEDVPPGEPLIAVAATSRLSKPFPPDYVSLPWHRKKHAGTQLNHPTAPHRSC